MAARLFGSYPNAKAHDPETFTAVCVKLFLKYDRGVVAYVVEELPGLVKKDWDGLPSYATIKDRLDARALRLTRDWEREQRIAKQIEQAEEDRRREAELLTTGGHDRIVAGFDAVRRKLRDDGADGIRESEKVRANRMAAIERGNRVAFEQECAKDGIDPSSNVSPSLRKLLANRSVEEERFGDNDQRNPQ